MVLSLECIQLNGTRAKDVRSRREAGALLVKLVLVVLSGAMLKMIVGFIIWM